MLSPKLHPQTADRKSRLPEPRARLPAPGWETRILIVDQDRQLSSIKIDNSAVRKNIAAVIEICQKDGVSDVG